MEEISYSAGQGRIIVALWIYYCRRLLILIKGAQGEQMKYLIVESN